MRRYYPYLLDQSFENANGELEKRAFLKTIDDLLNQKQYVRITLLTWNEEPLKEIQGEITSGTLTKDGSSSVRSTCQLSLSVDSGSYDVDNTDMDFAINKKIFLELGVKNDTDGWSEYPVLWFPQGVFFIASFSWTSSTSSVVTMNLTLKDKMCGLDGTCGGKFPAAVILDEMDTQNASGQYVTEKVLVYDIIQELVNHYGGEPLDNIVIEDVPKRVKQVVKWMGSNPLYLRARSDGSGVMWYEALVDEPSDKSDVVEYPQNADVGYEYVDFIYSSELTMNLGSSVTDALDKIKSYLGNYEYFYDEYGLFHFREIKNYLNTTQATTLLEDMGRKSYMVEQTMGKSVYTFSDKSNLVSVTNTPQYENIKNDYVIQGTREGTTSNASITVRYHLAIDKKPTVGNTYKNLLLYKEADTELVKAVFPLEVESFDTLPQPGNFNVTYRTADDGSFYYWDDSVYKEVVSVAYYPESRTDGYVPTDWRTELYLQGMLGKNLGTDQGVYYTWKNGGKNADGSSSWMEPIYTLNKNARIDTDLYFEELDAFWPQIYDLENQRFYGQGDEPSAQIQSLTDGNYYLDFIDPISTDLGKYSIQNIGRRTDAVESQDVNCLFTPDIPDIVWINADDDDVVEKRDEANQKGMPYSMVKSTIFENLYAGGYKNGAFDLVKSELWLHTTYQKSLSLSTLPVFYLQPNTRVTISDASTNTHGDFMVSSLSIPLGAGNTMTVACSQCIQQM